jgi:membrane protease subunit HflK
MDPSRFDPEQFIQQQIQRHGGRILLIAVVLIGVAYAVWSGYYAVPPDSQAVVKRFGAVSAIRGPGPHIKFPFGIDTATIVPVDRVLKQEFGFRTVEPAQRSKFEKTPRMKQRESLMLTGDLNVIDVEWVVQYQINDPDKWLHAVRDPVETVRDVSEAVMRRIIGNRLGSEALTVARAEIAALVRNEMQRILDDPKPPGDPNHNADEYDMGVHIGSVEMQDVTPPDPVKPAFNEVNKSRQERQSLINRAQKRRNQIIPKARGQAEQTIAEAEAYKAERVNIARGDAERFTAILKEYRQAEQVTRRRLYLEMIDQVLPAVGRLFVIEGSQSQPLPLLDLDEAAAAGRKGAKQ